MTQIHLHFPELQAEVRESPVTRYRPCPVRLHTCSSWRTQAALLLPGTDRAFLPPGDTAFLFCPWRMRTPGMEFLQFLFPLDTGLEVFSREYRNTTHIQLPGRDFICWPAFSLGYHFRGIEQNSFGPVKTTSQMIQLFCFLKLTSFEKLPPSSPPSSGRFVLSFLPRYSTL